jgi:hypothetical protein
MRRLLFCVSLVGAAAGSLSASARPASPDQCFLSRDYQDFRPVNDHSFYVRANLHDYYRIDLEGSCPTLTQPDARLITIEHGQSRICGPLDWELRVAAPPGPAIACIVKSQTRLTPQEAAAIPRDQRP